MTMPKNLQLPWLCGQNIPPFKYYYLIKKDQTNRAGVDPLPPETGNARLKTFFSFGRLPSGCYKERSEQLNEQVCLFGVWQRGGVQGGERQVGDQPVQGEGVDCWFCWRGELSKCFVKFDQIDIRLSTTTDQMDIGLARTDQIGIELATTDSMDIRLFKRTDQRLARTSHRRGKLRIRHQADSIPQGLSHFWCLTSIIIDND